jgi:hypothetical protein
VFWFFLKIKKVARLKIAIASGIVTFFLVPSQSFESKIKKSKKGS